MNKLTVIIAILFTTLQITAQTTKPYSNFSVQTGYLLSSNTNNAKESKPLFAGNGFTIGASSRYGKAFGIQSTVQFTGGSIDKTALSDFAKTKAGYANYTLEQKSNSWSQLAIMTGPSFQKFAKFPFSIDAQVGFGFNPNPNTILIKESEQFNYFSATEKNIVPVWDVNAQVSLFKILKKIDLGLRVSYGSNGGSLSIVAADIYAICCRQTGKCCR